MSMLLARFLRKAKDPAFKAFFQCGLYRMLMVFPLKNVKAPYLIILRHSLENLKQ